MGARAELSWGSSSSALDVMRIHTERWPSQARGKQIVDPSFQSQASARMEASFGLAKAHEKGTKQAQVGSNRPGWPPNQALYSLCGTISSFSVLYPEWTNLGWRCTRLWTWADYSYEVQWAAQVRSPCRRCWKALAQSFKILPIISSPSPLDQNLFNRGGGPLTMGESRRPLGAQNTCIPSVPNYKSILLLYSIHSKL